MMFEQSLPHGPSRAWRALLAGAITLCLAAFGSAAALAQSPQANYPDNQGDPPGRVARLSDLRGQVWLLSADSNEWVSAVRNQPITTGDRLATEAGGRAELQVGSSTVRVDAASELEVARLDDDHLSLVLHSGSAAARLRNAEDAGEFDLSTDDGRFRALRAGRYRFDRKDNASHLTVYEGQAVYEGRDSALTVNPGQHAEFWIDSNGTAQYAMSGPFNDSFAAWINERDRAVAYAGPAVQYVSPEMTGAEDLDRYGAWEQSPEYGVLWAPTVVAVDWAPYRAGHWAWVSPWGWTWVDDAPWGFAPFHYGRWVRYRERWCWSPGQRVVRPVYAPALVAWVGGSNVNVSVRVGGGPEPAVGWFPLAPREVYVPSYRVSPRYVQNVNITHVTNVTVINNVYRNPQAPRDYANRRYPDALTVVPAAVMTARQPVAPAASKWRDAPWAREIANKPASPVVVAPPVAAPVVAQRPADRSAIRPPPGFPAGQVGRPGGPGGFGGFGRGPAENTAAPGVVSPSTMQAGPAAQRPSRPEPPGRVSRGDDRRDDVGARPSAPAAPTVVAPAPSTTPRPSAVPQGAIPQGQIPNAAVPGTAPQPAPQRGGNPREGALQRSERVERPDRPERVERVEQPRPGRGNAENAPAPGPVQQRAQQAAPQPAYRAPEAARPPVPQPPPQPQPQPQPQQRAAEVQRPAAPEVRRPEPPPRARAQEEQRGDPRDRVKREQQ